MQQGVDETDRTHDWHTDGTDESFTHHQEEQEMLRGRNRSECLFESTSGTTCRLGAADTDHGPAIQHQTVVGGPDHVGANGEGSVM